MADFNEAYQLVLGYKGWWCNDEGDRGGEIYAGIAHNFFPEWKVLKIVDTCKQQMFKGSALNNVLKVNLELQNLVKQWYKAD